MGSPINTSTAKGFSLRILKLAHSTRFSFGTACTVALSGLSSSGCRSSSRYGGLVSWYGLISSCGYGDGLDPNDIGGSYCDSYGLRCWPRLSLSDADECLAGS